MSNELKKIFAGATAALAVGTAAHAQTATDSFGVGKDAAGNEITFDIKNWGAQQTVGLSGNTIPGDTYSGYVKGPDGKIQKVTATDCGCGGYDFDTKYVQVQPKTTPAPNNTNTNTNTNTNDNTNTNTADAKAKAAADAKAAATAKQQQAQQLVNAPVNKFSELVLPGATNTATIAPGASGVGPGGCSDSKVVDNGGKSYTVYVLGYSNKKQTVSETRPDMECNSAMIEGQARLAGIQKEIASYQADTQFDIATLPDCDARWITLSKRAPAQVDMLAKKVKPDGNLADLIAAKCEVKVVAVAAPAPKPPVHRSRHVVARKPEEQCPTEDKTVKACMAPNGQLKPLQFNR